MALTFRYGKGIMELCTSDLGFIPIGTDAQVYTSRFQGKFNGQGFEIKNLYVRMEMVIYNGIF